MNCRDRWLGFAIAAALLLLIWQGVFSTRFQSPSSVEDAAPQSSPSDLQTLPLVVVERQEFLGVPPPSVSPSPPPSDRGDPEQASLVTFIRSESPEVAVVVQLAPVAGDSPTVQATLAAGETGKQIVVQDQAYQIRPESGWTCIPSTVFAGRDHQIVRLSPPRECSFQILEQDWPVTSAEAFVLVASAESGQSGVTDAEGVVRFPSLPTKPLTLLVVEKSVLAAWRFRDGVGPGDRNFVMEVPDKRPERVLEIRSSASGRAIAGAYVVTFEGVRLPLESSAAGALRIPAHCGELPSLYVEAPDHRRTLLDLNSEASVVELPSTASVLIRAVAEDGTPVPEATVRAYQDSGNLLQTEGRFTWLVEAKTGPDGTATMAIPSGLEFENVVLLATHHSAGYGSHPLDIGSIQSSGTVIPVRLDQRAGLRVILEGVADSSSIAVEMRCYDGSRAAWKRESAQQILFPDVSMLDSMRITSSGGHFTELKRHKDYDSPAACLLPNFHEVVSGELRAAVETQALIAGEIQDANGNPTPWQPFRLLLRRSDASHNVKMNPGLGGHSPTELPGWIKPGGAVVYEWTSDAAAQFQIQCLVPGTYYCEFPDPSREGFIGVLGADMNRYTFSLPVRGKLVVRMPELLFVDYNVVGSDDGLPVKACRLEVCYSSFLQSFEVGARAHDGGRIRQWIAWNPGVRLRVTAHGYLPKELELPSQPTLGVDTRMVELERVAPMMLDFGAARPADEEREVRVWFELEPIGDGHTQVIESTTVTIPADGQWLLHGPFPDCMVRLVLTTGGADTRMKSEVFRFEPGKTRIVLR